MVPPSYSMKTYDQFPIFEGINWETSGRQQRSQWSFYWDHSIGGQDFAGARPVVPHGKISMGNDGLVGGLEHFLD